jgi:hypothetical protein
MLAEVIRPASPSWPVSYPRLLPQVTRMTTTMPPGDPKFAAAWEKLLRRIGDLLEEDARRVRDRAQSDAHHARALRQAFRNADRRGSG